MGDQGLGVRGKSRDETKEGRGTISVGWDGRESTKQGWKALENEKVHMKRRVEAGRDGVKRGVKSTVRIRCVQGRSRRASEHK